MSVTDNFNNIDVAVNETLKSCDKYPEQWAIHADVKYKGSREKPFTDPSLYAASIIRKTSNGSGYDFAFLPKNSLVEGQIVNGTEMLSSKQTLEQIGLDHASHYKKQTGDTPQENDPGIFYNLSQREVVALAKVNHSLAVQRKTEYEHKASLASSRDALGISCHSIEQGHISKP